MRKLYTSLLITGILFTACKKEQQASATDTAILGQWNWTAQYYGGPGNTLTPQNTGITEILILNGDNSWSLLQNGSTVNSGSFRTSVVTSSIGERVNSIYYRTRTGHTDSTGYYSVRNDTLVFSNDFMGTVGGGARFYKRKQ